MEKLVAQPTAWSIGTVTPLTPAASMASVLKTGTDHIPDTPFDIVPAVKILLDGVLRGAGAMGYFMTTTFTDLILRVGLAFLLSRSLESTGIWLAWPLGWITGTCLSILFYCKGVWKRGMT